MPRLSLQILRTNFASARTSLKQSLSQSIAIALSLSLAATMLFTYLNLSSLMEHTEPADKVNLYISDQAYFSEQQIESEFAPSKGYTYAAFRECPGPNEPSSGADTAQSADYTCITADQAFLDILSLQPKYGQNLDDHSGQDNVVIGDSLAKAKFGRPDDAVGKKLDVNSEERTVIGVLPNNGGFDNKTIGDINKIALTGTYNLDTSKDAKLFIIISDIENSGISAITKKLNLGDDISFSKLNPKTEDIYSEQDREELSIAAKLSAVVGLLSSGMAMFISTMLSSSKRTREIGIRKTMGATNRQIASQFVIEACLLALISSAAGVIISYTAITIKFNHNVLDTWLYSLGDGGLTFIGILFIAIAFSLIPAKLAGRKNIIDCLDRQT